MSAQHAMITGSTRCPGAKADRQPMNCAITSGQRPLAIAMPIHSFDPGGVEKVGLTLASAWHCAGHDVTVVLGRSEGEERARAPRLTYWLRECSARTAAFETIWMISCLYRYLTTNKVDVLFCPGNTYAIVGAAMRLLLGPSCPPLVLKISNDLSRRDMAPPVRAVYRLWLSVQGYVFDRLVGMAAPMHAEIREATGAPADRVRVVVNPALTRERFDRLSRLPQTPKAPWRTRYLAVGRLVRQKNFAMLIHAFSAQAGPGDTLTIAGEGPERAELEALAATLGVADRVHMPGHVAVIDELLPQADVFVLSSDYEGLPAALIEAMAAGLRIIATDCSSAMSYLLGGGRLGALVPVGNHAAFANAFRTVGELPFDPERSREIAAQFTIENAADSYLSIMSDVCQEPRPAPADFLFAHPYFGAAGG